MAADRRASRLTEVLDVAFGELARRNPPAFRSKHRKMAAEHPENFGTYLNSAGRFVFDVNDFDEAYLGHFTWDLQRFAAGLALLGWQKALPRRCAWRG